MPPAAAWSTTTTARTTPPIPTAMLEPRPHSLRPLTSPTHFAQSPCGVHTGGVHTDGRSARLRAAVQSLTRGGPGPIHLPGRALSRYRPCHHERSLRRIFVLLLKSTGRRSMLHVERASRLSL